MLQDLGEICLVDPKLGPLMSQVEPTRQQGFFVPCPSIRRNENAPLPQPLLQNAHIETRSFIPKLFTKMPTVEQALSYKAANKRGTPLHYPCKANLHDLRLIATHDIDCGQGLGGNNIQCSISTKEIQG